MLSNLIPIVSLNDRVMLSCMRLDVQSNELLNQLLPGIQNWDELIDSLTERGISPLLFKKLPYLPNSSCIPTASIEKLRQCYYRTLSRGMIMHEAFSKIMMSFRENDIKIIALKGIYLSDKLYGDTGLRQFSDIDVLIDPEDADKSLNVLSLLGYRSYDSKENKLIVKTKSESVHLTPMILNGISIELHTRLHRKSEKYQLDPQKVINKAMELQIDGGSVFVPDDLDMIIHLCIHADKHFKEGKIQFTCFLDIVNFAIGLKQNNKINDLPFRCREYGCENEVFKYLVLLDKYVGIDLPQQIVERYSGLLTGSIEASFIQFLHGEFSSFTAVPFHLENMRELNSLKKIHYIVVALFPPKEFMLKSFGSATGLKLLSFYPYRWFVGFKGLIISILRNR